jgi:hypothetical protein
MTTTATRRTADQVAAARDRLAAHFAAQGDMPTRAPSWARQSDLTALVATGRLARTVRTEWDRQPGNGSMFGGAGVCKRRRAYYVTATPAAEVQP